MLIASVSAEAVLSPRAPHFVHSEWLGLTYYDWIFPLFIVLAGCGMAFPFRSGVGWRRNARRILVLVLAGLAYNYAVAPERGIADLRFTGVLQLYAGLVLVVALLHHWLRRAAHWAIFTAALALAMTGYWWLVGRGCAGGIPQPTCNPTLAIDGRIFGLDHLYRLGERGFETEGVLGLLGALVIASAGATAGHLLKSDRPRRQRTVPMVAWATAMLGLGLLLALVIPPMKWLWTPSYGLITGSAGLALLTLWYWLVDEGPARRWALPASYPLRALGRNSLLVYFGSHVLQTILMRIGDPSVPERIAAALDWTGHPRVAYCALSVAAWWAVAIVLDKARIYVRA